MSTTTKRIPMELEEIPECYYIELTSKKGTLERLDYITYEAKTYHKKKKILNKTAYVYLPYGYNKNQKYNVFYLMHGGWCNETTTLGTPENPSHLKNVIDHAINDGKMKPLIIVCPTYNNESSKDSGNYHLAIQLTDLYHNELIYDLIPAVESKYSSFAENTSLDGLKASRDHRGFGGFSMGSVATWRTFEHCLDYFRYFMPMSGNLTSDGRYLDRIVKNSGYEWNDFFIYAMSGTADFAFGAFYQQIEAMSRVSSNSFRYADNENEGNLALRIRLNGVHDGHYANEYTYNGLQWFWNNDDKENK